MIKQTTNGRRLLLEVIDMILPSQPRRFNMDWWVNIGEGSGIVDLQQPPCGTVGCLAGWGVIADMSEEVITASIAEGTIREELGLDGELNYNFRSHLLTPKRREELLAEWREVHGEDNFHLFEYDDRGAFFIDGCLAYGLSVSDAESIFFTEEWDAEVYEDYREAIDECEYAQAVEITRNYIHSLID